VRDPTKPDLAYILSSSYSGSTLLTFLLAGHPGLATVGELKATAMGDVEKYDCSCGRRIRECPFWIRLSAELAERNVKFDVADFGTHFRCPGRPLVDRVLRAGVQPAPFELLRSGFLALPGPRGVVRHILERNRRIIEAVTRMREAMTFLDGSKDANRLLYLVRSGLWNVRVIYLTREGPATAYSFMKNKRQAMDVAAEEWRRTIEGCERALARLPRGSWIKVRHEDVCQDPPGTTAKIFDFLGLPAAALPGRFREVDHHIVGNVMRLRSTSEIRLDERWRERVTPEQLSAFEQRAGETNRRHGY
jgi:hypothetical protein